MTLNLNWIGESDKQQPSTFLIWCRKKRVFYLKFKNFYIFFAQYISVFDSTFFRWIVFDELFLMNCFWWIVFDELDVF